MRLALICTAGWLCAEGLLLKKMRLVSWDNHTELSVRVVASNAEPVALIILINSWGLPSYEYSVPMEEMAASGAACVEYETRGFWGSGGTVDFAGSDDVADARFVIDWSVNYLGVSPGTRISLVGVSYGAGLSLLTAAADARVDAVVAFSPWANLYDCLNWNDSPSRFWVDLLLSLGAITGRLDETVFEMWEDVRTHTNMDAVRAWAAERDPAAVSAQLARNDPDVLVLADMDDNLMHSQQTLDFWVKLRVTNKAILFGEGTHAEAELPGLLGIDNFTKLGPWQHATDWIFNRASANRSLVQFAIEGDPSVLAFDKWPTEKLVEENFQVVFQAGNDKFGKLVQQQGATLHQYQKTNSSTITYGRLPSALRTGVPVLSDFLKPVLPTPVTDLARVDMRHSLVFVSNKLSSSPCTICGQAHLSGIIVRPAQPEFQIYVYLYAVDAEADIGRLLTHVPYTAWNATPHVDFELPRLEFHITCFRIPARHRLALGFDMKDVLYTPATSNPGAAVSFILNTSSSSSPLLAIPIYVSATGLSH